MHGERKPSIHLMLFVVSDFTRYFNVEWKIRLIDWPDIRQNEYPAHP
jgi:hypothetical protein